MLSVMVHVPLHCPVTMGARSSTAVSLSARPQTPLRSCTRLHCDRSCSTPVWRFIAELIDGSL